ncbi:hypothetical protein C0J52_14693 [Blattella germanica]|nr:hypothetical protein C0J52_14693 [Blattella germanica]
MQDNQLMIILACVVNGLDTVDIHKSMLRVRANCRVLTLGYLQQLEESPLPVVVFYLYWVFPES